MVSNKTIWILIILSILLLGASFAISTLNTDADTDKLNTGSGGNQQGSINLVISPPAQPTPDATGAG